MKIENKFWNIRMQFPLITNLIKICTNFKLGVMVYIFFMPQISNLVY